MEIVWARRSLTTAAILLSVGGAALIAMVPNAQGNVRGTIAVRSSQSQPEIGVHNSVPLASGSKLSAELSQVLSSKALADSTHCITVWNLALPKAVRRLVSTSGTHDAEMAASPTRRGYSQCEFWLQLKPDAIAIWYLAFRVTAGRLRTEWNGPIDIPGVSIGILTNSTIGPDGTVLTCSGNVTGPSARLCSQGGGVSGVGSASAICPSPTRPGKGACWDVDGWTLSVAQVQTLFAQHGVTLVPGTLYEARHLVGIPTRIASSIRVLVPYDRSTGTLAHLIVIVETHPGKLNWTPNPTSASGWVAFNANIAWSSANGDDENSPILTAVNRTLEKQNCLRDGYQTMNECDTQNLMVAGLLGESITWAPRAVTPVETSPRFNEGNSKAALAVAAEYMHAEYVDFNCTAANRYFDAGVMPQPDTPCPGNIALMMPQNGGKEFLVRGEPRIEQDCEYKVGYTALAAQRCFEYTLVGHSDQQVHRGSQPVWSYSVTKQDVGVAPVDGQWKVVWEVFTESGVYVAGQQGYAQARRFWTERL